MIADEQKVDICGYLVEGRNDVYEWAERKNFFISFSGIYNYLFNY